MSKVLEVVRVALDIVEMTSIMEVDLFRTLLDRTMIYMHHTIQGIDTSALTRSEM